MLTNDIVSFEQPGPEFHISNTKITQTCDAVKHLHLWQSFNFGNNGRQIEYCQLKKLLLYCLFLHDCFSYQDILDYLDRKKQSCKSKQYC